MAYLTAIMAFIQSAEAGAAAIIQTMTPDQREAFWQRHTERVAPFHAIFLAISTKVSEQIVAQINGGK